MVSGKNILGSLKLIEVLEDILLLSCNYTVCTKALGSYVDSQYFGSKDCFLVIVM